MPIRPERLGVAERPVDRLRVVLDAVHDGRIDTGYLAASMHRVRQEQVTGPNGRWLEDEHRRLVATGVPAQSAAVYLTGWYAGSFAELVGIGLVMCDAAFNPRAGSLRWWVHPDGWVADVAGEYTVSVVQGHAWQTRQGVEVVATRREVRERAMAGLVEAVRPVVEACQRLADVDAAMLWNEVADAVGLILVYQTSVEVEDHHLRELLDAVAVDGMPWQTRPNLWFADHDRFRRVHIAQKGGCCLAHLEPAYEAEPASERYCSTCSLREPADCESRQIVWREQREDVISK